MHAIVERSEPRLLIEAQFGQQFIPEDPRVSDCVCALAFQPAVIPETPQLLQALTDARAREVAALPPSFGRRVVVIASRARAGGEGFLHTGTELELRGDTTVTFVTPTSGIAFRVDDSLRGETGQASVVAIDRAGPPRA